MSNDTAVIGWGSLIWDPRNLKINSKTWYTDGPRLPIEFARKTNDNRITLAIYPPYLLHPEKWVTTYWNFMDVKSIDEARVNLQNREGCPTVNSIGYLYNCGTSSKNYEISEIIRNWMKNKGISSVVWTDLGFNINLDEVIIHLKSLRGKVYKEARKYILKTPIQTKTPKRHELELFLSSWKDHQTKNNYRLTPKSLTKKFDY